MTTAPNESTDTTPPPGVITIDPEDTAQIERLAYVISAALGGASVPVEKLQRAARRFVTPRPTEPVACGAVVEDTDGVLWTRFAVVNIVAAWISETGTTRTWDDIDVMHVHRDGWVRP